ncbi:MAG: 16S rRNA (cytosine(1402)-N(4))-methyltransferase RsmH [Patescibacteria group bacterium]
MIPNSIIKHQPVMLATALAQLQVKPGVWYIDATLGYAGHTLAMIETGASVIGFDWDQTAVDHVTQTHPDLIAQNRLLVFHEAYSQLETIVRSLDQNIQDRIVGVLFDLGTSVPQLTSSQHGLSFSADGPLDMRMSPKKQGVTAADLLIFMSQKELTQVLRDFGGETDAVKLAKAIKTSPEPIKTTGQLVAIIERVKHRTGKLHPATKVFQALRIAVNSELDHLSSALPQALSLLDSGGRIVTIAFHEGEDRIAKHTFRDWEHQKLGMNISKHPLTPSLTEIALNPRSRSAKLRTFEKL